MKQAASTAVRALLPLLLLLLDHRASAYPRGAPASALQSMLPGHGVVAQPAATCPYDVDIAKNGNVYTLTLHGPAKRPYKGFLVEVRDDRGSRVGSFSGGSKAFQLIATSEAATHVSPRPKTSTTFTWSKPENADKVYVWYTVVENYKTFWAALSKELP